MTETIRNSAAGPAEVGAERRFSDFDIAPDVLEALRAMGIESPTPIQDVCIPSILAGRDVVGKAETGTGKTIGFGAPLVGRIDTQRVAVQALVLTPTRELAQQVAGVIELLGAGRGLGVALVVGGIHASEQILKLRSGSQVVVGTPGRVLDFLRERTLSLVWCETVVLDEADRMLDMGFIDDVSAILDCTPKERQTLLFSATIPPEINKLLKRYMRNPELFSTSQGLSTVADIQQFYAEAEFRNKFRTLQRVLDTHVGATVIIFCNTRRQAIDLDRMMWGHGYSAGALHGDQEQDVRFRILESFRKGDIKILVATDVASRGLDVEDVACVVNYEIPDEPESYVHRIGRTGRAQRSGEAISIVSAKELGSWRRIVKETGFKVARWGAERGSRDEGTKGQRPVGDESRPAGPESRNGAAAEQARPVSRPRRGGERSVAQENENPGVMPQSPEAPRANNPTPRSESSPAAGSGQSEGGDDRRRPRRRRRRGGGGGSGGPGDEVRGGSGNGPQRSPGQPPQAHQHRSAQGPERRGPDHRGPARAPASTPAQPVARYEGDDDLPTPEETQKWIRERPKTEAPKQPRMKLEELDDGYLKTDYFDFDPTLVERAGPPPKPRQPSSAGGEPHRPEPRAEGGRRPDRRPQGHGQQAQRPARPEGGGPPRPEPRGEGGPRHGGSRDGGPRHGDGRPGDARDARPDGQAQGPAAGPQASADGGDGQRRRRRRRRGRGRGPGGGPGGGGAQGGGA